MRLLFIADAIVQVEELELGAVYLVIEMLFVCFQNIFAIVVILHLGTMAIIKAAAHLFQLAGFIGGK